MRSSFFTLIMALISVASANTGDLPYYLKKDFTPVWLKKSEGQAKDFAEIPSFTLKDHRGETLRKEDLLGSPVIINFFFASCEGICPMAMSQLNDTKSKLAGLKNIRLASFSITPDLDTPSLMNEFAKKRGLDTENWFLLTGSAKEIKKITTAFKANKDVPSKKPGEFVHSENVFLIDKKGKLRGIYNISSQADMELLRKDSTALGI